MGRMIRVVTGVAKLKNGRLKRLAIRMPLEMSPRPCVGEPRTLEARRYESEVGDGSEVEVKLGVLHSELLR